MTFTKRTIQVAVLVAIIIAIVGALTIWSANQATNNIVRAQNDGWSTEFSDLLGISLLAEFDSSGPPAWDPAEHPRVFITSEGPGYSGLMSGLTNPGIAIIDADTYEVVATADYELEGVEAYFEPHGLGVSMDGRWIYLPTGTSPGFGAVGGGRWLIIDALTLKLNKVLSLPTNPHHAKAFTDSNGQHFVLAYSFREGGFAVLDPRDDNKVVAAVPNGELQGRGYLGFTTPDGQYLLISTRPPRGIEAKGFVNVVDTTTWRSVAKIDAFDADPVWVEFSADGTQAYVTGAHESLVARISMEGRPSDWEVDGITGSGSVGPYGARLNWDETQLWTVSKGEATHNRGVSLGLVNPTIMRAPPFFAWAPGAVGEFPNGCTRGDHATLHPDPDREELWISCNGTFNIIVWDMFDMSVIENIPMPNGGSTHSGAFVEYEEGPMGDFFGQVLSDQNGLHGSAMEAKREILGLNEEPTEDGGE